MEFLSSVLKNRTTKDGIYIIDESKASYKMECSHCGYKFRVTKTNFVASNKQHVDSCKHCCWANVRSTIISSVALGSSGKLILTSLSGKLFDVDQSHEFYEPSKALHEGREKSRKLAELIAKRNQFNLDKNIDMEVFLSKYKQYEFPKTAREALKVPTNRFELRDAILSDMRENLAESHT
ncbi:hypothetical protein QEF67_003186 [Klebsiella aerogenes]|uniref:hypothetical protein n=1 Tax=Klebsiella aerogenes TaxID=548 RepID=UPI002A2B974E|nr:hypothetical protein [Klebsiella aerogenes]